MGANWLNRGGKNRVHTWSPQKLRSIHLIGVDDQAAPYPCWTKRVFACPNQRPAAEALEAGIHAAVLRNELLLMAGFDSKPHDIKCRHIVLPTVKA
jgi:hypothetical protein